MNQLQTKRLLLEPSNISHAEFLLVLLNMPKWLLNIGDRNVHTIDDAENYITEKHLPQFKKFNYGNYVAKDKITLKPLGTVGLYNRPGLDVPDIGFAFLPEHEGKGYATEGALAIMHHVFMELSLTQISAITLPSNEQSIHTLKKLGLQFVESIIMGEEELYYYLITKDQFLRTNKAI